MKNCADNRAFEEGCEEITACAKRCTDDSQVADETDKFVVWTASVLLPSDKDQRWIDHAKIPVPGHDTSNGRYRGWMGGNNSNVERRFDSEEGWHNREVPLGKVTRLALERGEEIEADLFKLYLKSIKGYVRSGATSIVVSMMIPCPSKELHSWCFKLKPTMTYEGDFEVVVDVEGDEVSFVEFWERMQALAEENDAWVHRYLVVDLRGVGGVMRGVVAKASNVLR